MIRKALRLSLSSSARGLFLAFFLALFGFLLSFYWLGPLHAKLIAAVVFMVTLWTNEALPLGVVSLLPIVFFPALGILDTNDTAGNYANSIIFLFLGGFLLAIAVEKTGLHKIVARRLLKVFPATPRGVIFALAITSALLSAVLSNTTTALLLLPLAHYLAEEMRLKMRLVLAIAFGSSVGGIMTPIGTPPNLILMGFLEGHAVEAPSFVGWMALTAPLAAVMLVVLALILSIGVGRMNLGYELTRFNPMDSGQKRLLMMLATLAGLLVFNSPIEPYYGGLGLDERSLILFFGLMMFVPGVGFLEWADTKKIPYEIIFLFGAGFSLATAFAATGFDGVIASGLLSFGNLSPFVLMGCVALFVTFATGIMSNTALTAMVLPVIYTLSQEAGVDSRLFLMVATISASYAFMLPISTPPNAIALSSGAVRVGQMAAYGTLFNLIGVGLLMATAWLYWQWVL
jgi:sodium-dependent dicarboxylate transporter 2/3/5